MGQHGRYVVGSFPMEYHDQSMGEILRMVCAYRHPSDDRRNRDSHPRIADQLQRDSLHCKIPSGTEKKSGIRPCSLKGFKKSHGSSQRRVNIALFVREIRPITNLILSFARSKIREMKDNSVSLIVFDLFTQGVKSL